MPADACDCHAHVFGPASRYPFAADRGYTPPDCLLADYRRMLATLGLARCVLVQPSVYGTDNRATLDSLDELGDAGRAVVVVSADISDEEIARMHAKGARGVRLNLLYPGGGLTFADAETMAERIKPFGWHLQFLIDASVVPDLRRRLDRLSVPAVIDHFGHMPVAKGVRDPGFQALLGAVATGQAWVKLSSPYRITGQQYPPYDDVRPFAEALIQANPDRLVWATDWPHPGTPVPMPNDGALLDMLAQWAPDAALRRRILVDNPARLYGFGV